MPALATLRSVAEATLARQFEALGADQPASRRAAFERFVGKGLPTRRVESWHYTDLRAALTEAAPLAPPPDSAAIERARALLADVPKAAGARLVTVDGRFVPELSDAPPAGVAATTRGERALSAGDAMAALVEAMAPDSLTIDIAAGTDAGAIEIVHVVAGESGAARSVYSWIEVAVGPGGRAAVVETFLGASPHVQRHAATVLRLARAATLRHAAVVDDAAGLHLESQIVELEAEADLNAFGLVSGGALVRRQIFARLAGVEARIALGGLSLLDRERRADTTLEVVHAAPRGFSREVYRAIVADEAVGVFQGKVVVAPGAQKTDGSMKSQAVLLSPHAQMNAKPELEIFADDVVCGHGATVASIDPEQVFYLQARGIPKREAEAMLLEAFGVEAIARVGDEALAERLRGRLAAWLVGMRPGGTAGKETNS